MKTLDETIFEAPYTMTPWEENAIYYLKEYRDHMKNEIIKLQEEVKKQKEMIEFLEKPLTWDELKQKIGSIVWLEWSSNGNWAEIIHATDDEIEYFRFGTDELCYIVRKDYVPDKWQAYRREKR